MSPEEVLKLGETDQELLEIVQKLNVPKPEWEDIFATREMFAIRQAIGLKEMGPPPSDMIEEDQHISVRDGSKIRIRVSKHTNSPGGPLLVTIHGGGWCLGSLEAEQPNCRALIQAFNAVCVSVGYRLAPESKFPTAVDDSWDALKWIAENAEALGADPSKGFIVGGTSAGGNLSTVLAHMAHEEKLSPPLTGQWLCIPAVLDQITAAKVLPEEYKKLYLSHEQIVDPPGLGKKAIDFFLHHYAPDIDDHKFNPFIWPGGHKGQPPAYIQVCGADPLRDEGLLYERVLRDEAGVKTKLDIYPGMTHGFWAIFTMHSQAKKYYEDLISGFSWLLGVPPTKVEPQRVQNVV